MDPSQPHVITENGKRRFACFPAAVLVYIIDDQERFLMLSNPKRRRWEVVNGALEAGETLLEGALREAAEEAGPQVRLRPLGVVHINNFHYDRNARFMFSVGYLAAYQGGQVEPGDDMRGSQYRWFSLDELQEIGDQILVPVDSSWQLKRALELYRLWINQDDPPLQPELLWPPRNKHQV